MLYWKRILKVTFKSKIKNSSILFGDKEDLSISVDVNKYLSSLDDSCVITISNMNYQQIIKMIQWKYYEVKVECGYESIGHSMTIFEGEVIGVEYDPSDLETKVVHFLCTTPLVAFYGQRRINLSLNSGINVYSALKYVCGNSGINSNISPIFKQKFIEDVQSAEEQGLGSFLNALTEKNDAVTSSDATTGAQTNVYSVLNNENVVTYNLRPDTILLSSYPKLSENNLSLSVFPIYNFAPGNYIKVDNSLINISTSASGDAGSLLESVGKSNGYYLNKDGVYMIQEISYSLQNRGSSFDCTLKCKNMSVTKNIIYGE